MKKKKVGTISAIIKKATQKLNLTYIPSIPFLFFHPILLFIRLINENIKAVNECHFLIHTFDSITFSVTIVIMTYIYFREF